MRSFIELKLDLSDTDNIEPFENTTPINLISLICLLFVLTLLFWLIKLHIPGVWQNTREFIRQLDNSMVLNDDDNDDDDDDEETDYDDDDD